MAEPFLSEIRIFPFGQVPTGDGWAQCNGQLLPIDQQPGAVLAARHDVRRRRARELRACRTCARARRSTSAAGHTLGERGGEQAHTLSIAELPTHQHTLQASSQTGNTPVPTNDVLAANASRALSPRRRPHGDERADRDERRRQPGAPEHAAVPGAELRHRAHRHLPEPDLERSCEAMAQPFVGEIRMFAGNFEIAGWAFCDGPACCRSPRTRRSSSSSARPTAATARARSRCPTCAAASRSTRATASSSPRPAGPRRSR